MYEHTIIIPGKPKGKKRPRHGRNGAVYTPNDTKEYERQVGEIWKTTGGEIFHGAVKVCITAYFGIPKSAPKSATLAMCDGTRRPTIKPDIDNIEKIVLDGLNGIAYDDDKQVVEVHKWKLYNESPKVIVNVEEI